MLNNESRHAPARRSAPPQPPKNLCSCSGCRMHIKRLEAFNARLSAENDRLRRELHEGKRAA